MRIIIDADGCPVVRLAADCASKHGIESIIVCDCAHQFDIPGTQTIIVTKGSDSTDFRIVNMIVPGDIVITQDYGLAAMCLARRVTVISQNGLIYNEDNIDSMLLARHTARKIRNAGSRLKGPSKRTKEHDASFLKTIESLLIPDQQC